MANPLLEEDAAAIQLIRWMFWVLIPPEPQRQTSKCELMDRPSIEDVLLDR